MHHGTAWVRTGILFAILAAATSGCAGFSKALGGGKNPPDEFAITTKAPLVVPPDYSLRPPKPGETRPDAVAPSDRARQVLMGDPNAAPPSPGEQLLLRKADALQADPNIRTLLAAESGGRAKKDRSLANEIIFWHFRGGKVDDSAAPLKVADPAAWMAERERSIEKVIGKDGKVLIKKDKSLGLPGVF